MHEPKPSSSICATIFSARSLRSGLPCGSSANWEIFALTNNIAFTQAGTIDQQELDDLLAYLHTL